MSKKREVTSSTLLLFASLPLWGGTGHPRDGFLSFILVLGFLGLVLGLLCLIDFIKRKIREFLRGIGDAMQ